MLIEMPGKTVAITGIASGFGRAIARRFHQCGARVFGCDISRGGLSALQPDVPATTQVVDLCDRNAAADWVKSIEEAAEGVIDVVVNNAGGPLGIPFSPIEDVQLEDWDRIFGANIHATFIVCRAAVPALKRSGNGRIINITSGAGLRPSLTGLQAYTSVKHAMVGLTRQLAVELGPHGITVNSVAPGLQMTDEKKLARWNSYSKEKQAMVMQRIALGRLGEPEDIAKAVLFFASELADYVTGEILSVTGGQS